MKVLTLAVFCLMLTPGRQAVAAPGCDPIGDIRFLCDVVGPEDFAIVPGSDWLITSGNRAGQGAIRALDVRAQKIVTLFPSSSITIRPDAKTYPTCPGPLDMANPDEKARSAVHGLYLKPGSNSRHSLFVVHHGGRESIEVFEVDGAARPPSLTWVGCVVAPDNGTFNAVVALPEGGVAATNIPRGRRSSAGRDPDADQMGAVWEWHAATGWLPVPGSETSRINGLEIAKDGKWFYIAGWGDQTFIRLPRGEPSATKDVLPMPFRIDNLRLMANGSILAAGHGGTALCSCPTETWHVGWIDPIRMSVQELLRQPYVEGFGAATVAVQIRNEIWIGTNRGDRIGHFPAR
jgi:hypothetical protein